MIERIVMHPQRRPRVRPPKPAPEYPYWVDSDGAPVPPSFVLCLTLAAYKRQHARYWRYRGKDW